MDYSKQDIIDAFNAGVEYANSKLPQTFDHPAERYYDHLINK